MMLLLKFVFSAIIVLIVGCSNMSSTDVVSTNKSVSVCYEPHNETEYKVDWYEATVFVDGDSVGTVYPDSDCLQVDVELGDVVTVDFSCGVLVNDKIIKSKFHQIFVVENMNIVITVP